MLPSMSLELLPPSNWNVFWSYIAPATAPCGETPGWYSARLDASEPKIGR